MKLEMMCIKHLGTIVMKKKGIFYFHINSNTTLKSYLPVVNPNSLCHQNCSVCLKQSPLVNIFFLSHFLLYMTQFVSLPEKLRTVTKTSLTTNLFSYFTYFLAKLFQNLISGKSGN